MLDLLKLSTRPNPEFHLCSSVVLKVFVFQLFISNIFGLFDILCMCAAVPGLEHLHALFLA
jgi:hypothetical protein